VSSHVDTRFSAARAWPGSWPVRVFILFILLAMGLAAHYVVAQSSNIAVTTAFTPADPARGQQMDVGGVWNGTTEVTNTTGDTFTLTISNLMATQMYNVRPSVTLPAGFTLVPGSVTGATASVAGQVVTFTLSPVNIPAGGQRVITYGLRAASSVNNGTYALAVNTLYKATSGGADLSDSTSQPILVARGDSVISKTPDQQLSVVNNTVTWTVTVTNTGLGGLFDVVIDESNAGSGLQINSLTQVSPTTPVAGGSGLVRTLPYLAPGETFSLTVQGTVDACTNIHNTVQTNDRTGMTADSVTAAVFLDLQAPEISYTVPPVNMVYGEAVPVNITIQNNGSGPAEDFRLRSTLHQQNVTVGNVSAGWSYDTATGIFTRTANSGTLAGNSTAALSFTLSQPDACTVFGGGNVVWEAVYENFCDEVYVAPAVVSVITGTDEVPSINLTKTAQSSRVVVGSGEDATFTLQLSTQNADNFATNSSGDVVVVDTLPAAMLSNLTITPSGGSYALVGNQLTWTVPRTVLEGTPVQTLQLAFDVPVNSCEGGELLQNTAMASVTTKTGCVLNSSAAASILLVNNPDAVATQEYNIANAPNGSYETGSSSADGTRDQGEGEFIPITSTYSFGAGYPGKFAGSTYVDNFGGITGQTLVPGSLRVSVNGGAPQAVPGGAILQSAGELRLNLDFLAGAGFANDENVSDNSFVFTYQTTVPDSALPLPGTGRSAVQVATLTLADGTAGGGICQDATFRQGDFLAISRAAAAIGVSMPDQIDTCQPFPVTITVSNATSQQARNALITLLTTGDYDYLTGQTPVYGGSLVGNVLYNENSGNFPTFQVTSNSLTGTGTITVQMRRKVNAGTTPSALQARVDYDDNETSPATARTFSATGSDAPVLIKDSELILTVTPQTMTVVGTQAEWLIYVTNTGNGTAYNSILTDTSPSGIVFDVAETNLDNPGYPATLSGATLSWNLGDIPTGETRTIRVTANIDGSTCAPDNAQSIVKAEWGCAGDYRETATKNSPIFTLATGRLQTLHDTSQSFFALCEEGTIVLILRNTGAAHVYDAELNEVLTAGLTLVPGSVEYSLNGGAYTAGPNPTGAGTGGSPYRWTKTEIPVLADLAPQGVTGTNEVRVRFRIQSEEYLSAQPALPEIQASATGRIACGNTVNSPGQPFALPARRPNITLVKDGRNITANPAASFTDTIYGGVGDEVEWRIQITNNGPLVAKNVRLKDVFAGSGATTAAITGPGGFSGTITHNIPLAINDIPASTTHTYIVKEILGGTCVNADNTASVTWGCVNNGLNAESNISWPTDNSDTSRLNTVPNFDSGISQTITASSPTVNNGRVRGRVTLTNAGGTAQNLSFDLTVPANLELDTTVMPTITSTTSSGATVLNAITVTGSHPTYTLTFNNTGQLRNGQNVLVTYYLLQRTNFDLTANGGIPLSGNPDPATFLSPETTANSLDPTLPSNGTIAIALNAESTCGMDITASHSASVNPLTPDLDITVSPLTQTVQTDESYLFDFYFTITNAGDANSVANHIVFSLPFLGSTWQSTSIFGPNGETGTTSITLSQPISAGSSVVVRVRGTTNAVTPTFDLRMVGQVEGNLYGQDGTTDTGNNYSLDRAAPVITSDVNLSGYVYLDSNINAQRDAGEDGTGLTLWAKLVPTGGGPAVKVVSVNATTGVYQFTQVDDGSYSVVIDDNDTLADVTPAVLTGWLGTEFPSLERTNVIIGDTNVINQNFGLFNGGFLQGRVFLDTGTGGGTANDGAINGGETGIPAVVVRLTDVSGGTVYASTITDALGNYTLNVPTSITTGTALRVVQANISGYISTGAETGNSGGTYNHSADAIIFSFTKGATYNGLNFGDVPPSEFIIDGNKTVEPGGVVYFPHTFTAATAGEVTFSTTHNATPNQPGWTQTIYHDLNANGMADPGEPLVTGAIAVNTGDEVHIVIREYAPANATTGAKDIIQVTASFELDTATPAIVQTLIRTDIATVNFQDELQLEKVVDLATANRGEELTYTITYRNNGTQPISNLAVHDTTPAFTTFVSAAFGTTPAGLTTGAITAPTAGTTGPINWNFTGTLAAGAVGTVTFKVKVNE
jgi:uncharacterized repeat protein (TIGR01451 family)